MYIGIKHLHSLIALITLLLLIFAIVYAIYCRIKSKPFTPGSKKIMLLGFTVVHIQVLVGLVLYFISPFGSSNLSSGAMKNSIARLYAVEHPLLMILAAVLVSVGYMVAKKTESDNAKFNKIILFYTLGLILILSRLPWFIAP